MNKPVEPRIFILLGIPFHDVTMSETLEYLDGMIERRKPAYLATANLDFTAQASKDVELQRILFDAELVLCDGTPLVWASRWLGAPLRERVAGSDLMPFLFSHAQERGYRLFFLGSSEEVLAAAVAKCEERYPKLTICGSYSPPYAKLLEINDEEIARRVREARADILLVAMGCPKQEKWIYRHYQNLGVPATIGIGASLDFIAGKFRRAPVWMRVCGLEWLFRLIQEPTRLFNRYYFDLLFFVDALRKQRRLLKNQGVTIAPSGTVEPSALESVVRYKWTGRIDAAAVDGKKVEAAAPEPGKPNVVIECSEVSFIDSTGLGLFIRSFRLCKQNGGAFVVLAPSEAVAKMLTVMRLDRLIPIAKTEGEILPLIRLGAPGAPEADALTAANGTVTLPLAGEITAATVESCETFLRSVLGQMNDAKKLTLDLAKVSFIDSSGLGFLIKTLKLVKQRPGTTLSIENPTPNVRNVIQLANLSALLGVAAQR